MAIWTSLTTVGQPTWTASSTEWPLWVRYPALSQTAGFAFGEGGFGEGGFGAGVQQSGVGQPTWTPWTTD